MSFGRASSLTSTFWLSKISSLLFTFVEDTNSRSASIKALVMSLAGDRTLRDDSWTMFPFTASSSMPFSVISLTSFLVGSKSELVLSVLNSSTSLFVLLSC
uniref:Uncharacterized protein n=1 Tax=Cacopsylla melanoneura TaxID=428564 RepID=A0A8D8UYP5_9HEMI